MVRILFLLMAVFISLVCFGQPSAGDCSRFKTGNFSYRDSSNAIHDLKRKKSHQTDINKQTGLLIKYKISWLSDCQYKLTQIWANQKKQRKLNRSWQVLQITSVKSNVYEYSCSCTDGSKMAGVVVKLTD